MLPVYIVRLQVYSLANDVHHKPAISTPTIAAINEAKTPTMAHYRCLILGSFMRKHNEMSSNWTAAIRMSTNCLFCWTERLCWKDVTWCRRNILVPSLLASQWWCLRKYWRSCWKWASPPPQHHRLSLAELFMLICRFVWLLSPLMTC